MILLLFVLLLRFSSSVHVPTEEGHNQRALIVGECLAAAELARLYKVHIHDLDGDGDIDIDDIGPAVIEYGLYWLDDAPKDGILTIAELRSKWKDTAPWLVQQISWLSSFATTSYSPEQVFIDCASKEHPTRITYDNYMALRHKTCLETCRKAVSVLNFLGKNFGVIE